MSAYPDGSIQQGALARPAWSRAHLHAQGPMEGIVLAVRYADEPRNVTATMQQDGRGYAHEALVLIVNGGREMRAIIDHVLILPDGRSNGDEYAEDLPNGCSRMLDASEMASPDSIDVDRLDGERVLVDFIGGNTDRPFILKYMPHPWNRTDPATSGREGRLDQRRRRFQRVRGIKLTILDDGTIYLDMSEANSRLAAAAGGTIEREPQDAGGDVHIDMKAERAFEVNFNPPVDAPLAVPGLPQANPPAQPPTDEERSDALTRVTLGSLLAELVAGKQARVFARGAGADGGVLIGGTPEEYESDPDQWQKIVLGAALLARFNDFVDVVNVLVGAYRTHAHDPTTGLPTNAASVQTAVPMEEATDLSEHGRIR